MPISRHRPKKGKRPVQRDNKPKRKKEFYETTLGGLVLVAGLIISIVTLNSVVNILNFPYEIWGIVTIPILIAIVYAYRTYFLSCFNERPKWRLLYIIPYIIFIPLAMAFSYSSIFGISLYYYITLSSKNNLVETYRCSLHRIDKGRKPKFFRKWNQHSYLGYKFKDESNYYEIPYEKAEELKENDNYKKYYIYLEVRKGPFETYVIQNKELRLKPIL